MVDQVKGTEEFFLKIVKHAILGLMGLALIAIPILLIYGGTNFMSQPKEPEPAKSAPPKEVTTDGLKQYLLDLQKRQEEVEKFDPTKKKASELDQPPAIYLVEAVRILECSQTFAVAVDALIDANSNSRTTTDKAVEIRGGLEAEAGKPERGASFVTSHVAFLCKALVDPAVIAFKKGDKFKVAVVRAIRSYHEFAWDKIVSDRKEFESDEASRVTRARASEAVRIAADRAKAMTALTAAAGAFAAFMLLAIYLILAKIETNMRDIDQTLRTRPI